LLDFRLGNRLIGTKQTPLVIAEVGINHGGEVEKAKQMVRDAYSVGAECVKFQMHIIEDEMVPIAKESVPGHTKESIWEIIEKCALTVEEHVELKKLCEYLGIIYLCTPFSRAAADTLESIGIQSYKIGSGECNNYPLIKHIAEFQKPIILSTGMNDLESIRPSVKILKDAEVDFALLHCTSLYPTPYEKVRLGAMQDLINAFPEVPIGLSDHSVGNYACFGAVALGASIVEKHFTSDKSWPGPDIPVSINPLELKDLIIGTRAIHVSSGGTKEILDEEKPTINFAYSSVVSIKHIKKSEIFSRENIWVKRPGGGIPAKKFDDIIGKTAIKDIEKDVQLKEEDIKWDCSE